MLEQRCIFHKIKNVGENFCREGGGSVREITSDASHVFAGTSKRAIKQRLYYFRKKWEHRQPMSMAARMCTTHGRVMCTSENDFKPLLDMSLCGLLS